MASSPAVTNELPLALPRNLHPGWKLSGNLGKLTRLLRLRPKKCRRVRRLLQVGATSYVIQETCGRTAARNMLYCTRESPIIYAPDSQGVCVCAGYFAFHSRSCCCSRARRARRYGMSHPTARGTRAEYSGSDRFLRIWRYGSRGAGNVRGRGESRHRFHGKGDRRQIALGPRCHDHRLRRFGGRVPPRILLPLRRGHDLGAPGVHDQERVFGRRGSHLLSRVLAQNPR